MKTVLIITLGLLLFAVNTQAQTPAQSFPYTGVIGAIDYTKRRITIRDQRYNVQQSVQVRLPDGSWQTLFALRAGDRIGFETPSKELKIIKIWRLH